MNKNDRFERLCIWSDVVLSNLWATKIITAFKKKPTRGIHAVTLVDILRYGYISLYHILNKDIVEQWQLVRYRDSLVKTILGMGDFISLILVAEV